jgi:hypothetical protein
MSDHCVDELGAAEVLEEFFSTSTAAAGGGALLCGTRAWVELSSTTPPPHLSGTDSEPHAGLP